MVTILLYILTFICAMTALTNIIGIITSKNRAKHLFSLICNVLVCVACLNYLGFI